MEPVNESFVKSSTMLDLQTQVSNNNKEIDSLCEGTKTPAAWIRVNKLLRENLLLVQQFIRDPIVDELRKSGISQNHLDKIVIDRDPFTHLEIDSFIKMFSTLDEEEKLIINNLSYEKLKQVIKNSTQISILLATNKITLSQILEIPLQRLSFAKELLDLGLPLETVRCILRNDTFADKNIEILINLLKIWPETIDIKEVDFSFLMNHVHLIHHFCSHGASSSFLLMQFPGLVGREFPKAPSVPLNEKACAILEQEITHDRLKALDTTLFTHSDDSSIENDARQIDATCQKETTKEVLSTLIHHLEKEEYDARFWNHEVFLHEDIDEIIFLAFLGGFITEIELATLHTQVASIKNANKKGLVITTVPLFLENGDVSPMAKRLISKTLQKNSLSESQLEVWFERMRGKRRWEQYFTHQPKITEKVTLTVEDYVHSDNVRLVRQKMITRRLVQELMNHLEKGNYDPLFWNHEIFSHPDILEITAIALEKHKDPEYSFNLFKRIELIKEAHKMGFVFRTIPLFSSDGDPSEEAISYLKKIGDDSSNDFFETAKRKTRWNQYLHGIDPSKAQNLLKNVLKVPPVMDLIAFEQGISTLCYILSENRSCEYRFNPTIAGSLLAHDVQFDGKVFEPVIHYGLGIPTKMRDQHENHKRSISIPAKFRPLPDMADKLLAEGADVTFHDVIYHFCIINAIPLDHIRRFTELSKRLESKALDFPPDSFERNLLINASFLCTDLDFPSYVFADSNSQKEPLYERYIKEGLPTLLEKFIQNEITVQVPRPESFNEQVHFYMEFIKKEIDELYSSL